MALTLLGNGPELHDRLAGRAGAFAEADAALPDAQKVVISVRRANVFHLGAIVEYALSRRGKQIETPRLSPSIVGTLAPRFEHYLGTLARLCENTGVEIQVEDEKLRPLFAHVTALADEQNETELLRLLSVVCDTALVGPHWFVFEVINRCNARCRYCNIHAPARSPGPEFLHGQLSFELFEKTIADLARLGTDGVTILANGEPLLHPDFARMIHTARAAGLRVNFFTNGLLLDEDKARLIIDAGVDEIFVTVSAADAAVYAGLHAAAGEADWQRLLGNLRGFFRLREKAGGKLPRAYMVNVICGPNAHQVPAMAALAGELGFDVLRPQLLRLDDKNRDLALSPEQTAALADGYDGLVEKCRALDLELWEGYGFQLGHARGDAERWSGDTFVERGCLVGFSLGLAKADGRLSFCCTVKPVADLAHGRFAELWAGGLYHRARLAAKNLRAGGDLKLLDGSPLYDDACHHCDNHDINLRMHQAMDRYRMWEFLG